MKKMIAVIALTLASNSVFASKLICYDGNRPVASADVTGDTALENANVSIFYRGTRIAGQADKSEGAPLSDRSPYKGMVTYWIGEIKLDLPPVLKSEVFQNFKAARSVNNENAFAVFNFDQGSGYRIGLRCEIN